LKYFDAQTRRRVYMRIFCLLSIVPRLGYIARALNA
jgi:hypothetical protein